MMRTVIVFSQAKTFTGWPANNGGWVWGNELLVGFTSGEYAIQAGHHIREPYTSRLARSLDGGESWKVELPQNFLGCCGSLASLDSAIDFTHSGFAMRVFSTGYHGCDEPAGGYLYSLDRGRSWQGPHPFSGLHSQLTAVLSGSQSVTGCQTPIQFELTPRTDIVVEGSNRLLLMLSVRQAGWGSDRVFAARTIDGGQSFQFVSWMVQPADPYRAVMPSTVRLGDGRLVSAVRRRDMNFAEGWIDAYISVDNAASWNYLSRVGECGKANGNPPALALLQDGRLACAYGNRTRRQMLLRLSEDGGLTWQDEIVIRSRYASLEELGISSNLTEDFGYPRLLLRPDGKLVAIYYWADAGHPEQHIAATILSTV